MIKFQFILSRELKSCSEELEEISEVHPDGEYLVTFDPLDGSSNIDVNITVGTIFCVMKYHPDGTIHSGRDVVMAGYTLYGSSTQMIIAHNHQIDIYLMNELHKFKLMHQNYRIPKRSKIYSINSANQNKWSNPKINKFIESLLNESYSMRYVGAMVSDAHRTIIKGGVFMYPKDSKNKEGKIRLVYEAYHFAYIFECGGGYSCNEDGEILDLPYSNNNLHQKTSVMLFDEYEKDLWDGINYR